MGRLGRLAQILPRYAEIAWNGLVLPRKPGRAPRVVAQGVILDGERVLLSVRHDLRGWELPGGNLEPGECVEDALRREIREETGLEVELVGRIGDYVRTGFLPHTACVFRCRVLGGELRPSMETPKVAWFPLDRVPSTLFPWYDAPLADATANLPEPVTRHEHNGVAAIWAGMSIDLRMRLSDDAAGAPPTN
jgi:8-oxo-dGTP diphosphatase